MSTGHNSKASQKPFYGTMIRLREALNDAFTTMAGLHV